MLTYTTAPSEAGSELPPATAEYKYKEESLVSVSNSRKITEEDTASLLFTGETRKEGKRRGFFGGVINAIKSVLTWKRKS